MFARVRQRLNRWEPKTVVVAESVRTVDNFRDNQIGGGLGHKSRDGMATL